MIYNIFKYKDYLSNISFLSLMDIFKLVFPFFIIPFLISKLGVEGYGLVVFAQVLVSYVSILSNFGIDISAVKDIAEHQGNKGKLNEIFTTSIVIKSIICIFSSLVFLLFIFFIDSFYKNWMLFLASLIYPLSEVLLPLWFFQGISKLKSITIYRFISSLISMVLIFVFIDNQKDDFLIPLINGGVALLTSFLLILRVRKDYSIEFVYISFVRYKIYLMKSFPFFISRISVLINTSIAKLVAGFYLSMGDVALLDIADKLISSMKIPLNAINTVLFPYMAKNKNIKITNKLFYFQFVIGVVLNIAFILMSKLLITYFSKNEFVEQMFVVNVYSITILICSITFYLGTPLLVSFGYSKYFNRSVYYSSILSIGLYLLLSFSKLTSLYLLVFIVIISEMFVAIYRYYYCRKFKLLKIF